MEFFAGSSRDYSDHHVANNEQLGEFKQILTQFWVKF